MSNCPHCNREPICEELSRCRRMTKPEAIEILVKNFIPKNYEQWQALDMACKALSKEIKITCKADEEFERLFKRGRRS